MIKNYFTIAFRNLSRHPFFSSINIFGLTLGLASCMLIFIYVTDELSYDRFHAETQNIFRIGLKARIAGREIATSTSSLPVGPAMRNEIPGVETFTRLFAMGPAVTFKNDEKVFAEKNVLYADSNFFSFFNFPLLEGDKKTALKEPHTIVITQAIARKYFDGSPIGKFLVIGNDNATFKVTGVAAEAPSNSHIHFNGILSFETILNDPNAIDPSWTANGIQTYIRKNPIVQKEAINSKLEDMVEKYVGKELEKYLSTNFKEFRKQGGFYSYVIYPLTDSHLRSQFQDDLEPAGDILYVFIFSGICLFILLLACINFMNLSTAQSAGRAKEVGLRKTLGSLRTQMMLQFLSESLMFSFVAVGLAVALCYLTLPYFNVLSGKQLTLNALNNLPFFAAAFGLALAVGLLAGSYPAFYLTSFNVVEVIKGKAGNGLKDKGVRRALVVFQFSISILLTVITSVVSLQLTYMKDKNLGFDKRNVLIIQSTGRLHSNRSGFYNDVKNLAGVQNVSFCSNNFPGVNSLNAFREKGKNIGRLAGTYAADWDHADVMKFKLASGRYFSREFKTDSSACIVNQAFVKEFGWPDALNQEVVDPGDLQPKPLKIIGVVEDFNYETLKQRVRPVLIRLESEGRTLMIRYVGSPQILIASIEKSWKKYAVGEPLDFTFLDQDFDKMFRVEQRLHRVFTVFTILAICIACLGLYALAAFTTEQRTREIVIRKVMGATAGGLMVHLSKEFVILVLIAIIPALVLGWYLATLWLAEFTFRVILTPQLFMGVALTAIIIAWLSVGYHSLKAANAKPVNSLRHN
jgi:putative ABC transport system permease protein